MEPSGQRHIEMCASGRRREGGKQGNKRRFLDMQGRGKLVADGL